MSARQTSMGWRWLRRPDRHSMGIHASVIDGGNEGCWRRGPPCALHRLHTAHEAALNAVEPFGQRKKTTRKGSELGRAPNSELSLEACRREDNGAQWAYEKNPRTTWRGRGPVIFRRRVPGKQLTGIESSPAQAQARFSMGAEGLEGSGGRKRGNSLPLSTAKLGFCWRFWVTSPVMVLPTEV